jgi:integrase
MPRPRFQTGHVCAVGKKWRGEWYETVRNDDGTTRRVHHSAILEADTKTKAKQALAAKIAPCQNVRPDAGVSLRSFIESKWLPLKKAKWKESTKLTSEGILQKQIIEPLGDIPLRDLDRSRLQTHLNRLASEGYSHSIVQHTTSFLRQIFDEAEEQAYVVRSPARRLEIPRVHPERTLSPDNAAFTGKPFLSVDQLRKLLSAVEGRDRLIMMLAGLMAMRPGEIFALTWDAWRTDTLFIMSRVYRRKFDTPKTPASMAQLPIPKVVRETLDAWKVRCSPESDFAYIFPGKVRGTVLDQYNFSNRTLKPCGTIAVGTGFPVTFQVLRRTWATHAPNYGAGLKEVEVVLRHSASLNFTTGTYIQGIRERVLAAMDAFANAVCTGLPEHAEIPVEPELLPQSTTPRSVNHCAEVAELADAPA